MPPAKRSTARKRTTATAAARGKAKSLAAGRGAGPRAATAKSAAKSAAGAAETAAFDALVRLMKRQTKGLLVTQEGPGGLQVSMNLMFRGKPLWFGGVRRGRSYVSYHLMPVYMFPDLLTKISPALRRRMQGKSCFNFRTADPQLLRDLEALTKSSVARMKRDGVRLIEKFEKGRRG